MSEIDLTDWAAERGGSPKLRGHLATPAGDGPWPGVVMIHEAFGLNDVTRRQADRLAAAGYLVVAVDLFSAGGARRCLVSTMRALVNGKGKAFGDIEAARAWLVADGRCTGKAGVIGFCMGGGFALMTAQSGFDASSVNYGQLPSDLDAVVQGACPVVGSFGAKDRTLRGAADQLESALERARIPHDVKEYPDAGHSFLNDADIGPRVFRPLLRVAGIQPEPASAVDAWARIEAFFAEHLS